MTTEPDRPDMGQRERAVARLVHSERTLEGGGFPVRRPFPTREIMQAMRDFQEGRMGTIDT